MKHFLIVVDMQRDFIDGSLGTPEAQAIVPRVVEKILQFDGEIFAIPGHPCGKLFADRRGAAPSRAPLHQGNPRLDAPG